MSAAPYRILIVDNDPSEQALLKASLQKKYDLKIIGSGEQVLAIASDWKPHAILLELDLPDVSGYQICESLKNNPDVQDIPVVFISVKNTANEKVHGFKIGADEYIIKPFDSEILNARVERTIRQYLEIIDLNNRVNIAQDTAFEAMTSSAELGRALRFVEHTYAIPSFDVLANSLFQCLDAFGLKTSVMFLSNEGPLFYSHNSAEISSLEKDLLQINHTTSSRFTDFGSRTFCNYRQVCLLIKNMPLDNPERYGRIKDTVPFILGAVDGKIRALDLHVSLMAQVDSLGKSVSAIGSTLNALTQEVSLGHAGITNIMKSLLYDLEAKLPRMGLENDQEAFLVERIDRAFTDALSELDRSTMLGQSLTGVVRLLSHLQGQQRKMVQSAFIDTQAMESHMPNDGDSLSSDVELF